ncbi:arsenate reductase (glutaredoxin) [Methyloversatilis discipulorum]|uniref:arsenate reductase (glutaredoxin) n=1 Tax=Methyloversatilis discipulorum TaxID=1119528 RepID=UPI001A4BE0A8|nr:arsenate reductase (glutaredoxin) [Methyloversatilis discipulorum]MBL8470030.1 arsenate reductase (glutaredoxin) [Methyloversatilis discipulorum]
METDVTVYHNPKCSNSRGVLEILRERGITPHVVEYLKTPLDAGQLKVLVAACQVPVRELIRSKEAAFAELSLGDPALDDDTLIAAIAAHPVLLNRPIVVTPRGARLCRPPETVLDVLP